MKPRGVRLLAACVLASCLPSLTAAADVLIESHPDQRPADADAALAPFRAELEAAGVKVRAPDIVTAAGDQLPLPGVSDPTLDRGYVLELSAQVALGTKQVFRGEYATGLATLEGVITRARANPGLVVADASSPGWLTKAYAAIAFAHIRSQRLAAATEAITEQIRSFPEDPIGRIVGPEVATRADEVRKALDAAPHGTLKITVSEPDVQIFIDERARGAGSVLRRAVPGTYRLLLVRPGMSRRYAVRVLPDKTTELQIDWAIDAAFTVTSNSVGLTGSRRHEERTQAAVARYARGARQHDVLVASIVERSGRRLLSGAIFEKKTGVLLRHKAVVLGAGDDACARSLAQHLLTGNSSPCLLDPPTGAPPRITLSAQEPRERPPAEAHRRSRVPLYAAAGTAAAAFIVGGYLFHIDGSGTCGRPLQDCPYRYASAGSAWAFVGAGVAAAGFGLYWQLRSPRDGQRAAVSLNPTSDGALASVQGSF
jgi:hypothetical protein